MTRISFCMIALTIVSACGVPALEPTAPPVNAGLTSAALQERLSSGRTETMIRAYIPDPTGDTAAGTEVAGATCDLASDELGASIVTPQAVILPSFKQSGDLANRGVPGAIAVRCSYQGLRGATLLTATEKELALVQGAGVGGILLGLAVSGVVASATPWKFAPAAAITLEQQ